MDFSDPSSAGDFVAIAASNLARIAHAEHIDAASIDCAFLRDCIFQNQSTELRSTAMEVCAAELGRLAGETEILEQLLARLSDAATWATIGAALAGPIASESPAQLRADPLSFGDAGEYDFELAGEVLLHYFQQLRKKSDALIAPVLTQVIASIFANANPAGISYLAAVFDSDHFLSFADVDQARPMVHALCRVGDVLTTPILVATLSGNIQYFKAFRVDSGARVDMRRVDVSCSEYAETMRDIDQMKSFDHKNILRILHVETQGRLSYVFVEPFAQGDIEQFLALMKTPLPVSILMSIVAQMAASVAYLQAQSHVVLAVKPANFAMCIHPDRTVGIKLHSCPGLCSESDLSLSFELQCEMPYVAPELLCQSYAESSVCWSIGVILFRLMFRKFPFPFDPISASLTYDQLKAASLQTPSLPAYSVPLRTTLTRLLDVHPDRRLKLKDVNETLRGLEPIAAGVSANVSELQARIVNLEAEKTALELKMRQMITEQLAMQHRFVGKEKSLAMRLKTAEARLEERKNVANRKRAIKRKSRAKQEETENDSNMDLT